MSTPRRQLAARLNRAESNLNTLNAGYDVFREEGEYYSTTSQKDARTNAIHYYGELLRQPPAEEWASIIGDVLHNLRATLDNLVWHLGVGFSGPPPSGPLPPRDRWRRLQFPIVVDPARWNPRAPDGPLWAVDPSLDTMFKKYQPFSTGKSAPERETLAILQELWNIDKHRHIHVVVVWAAPRPEKVLARPMSGGTALIKDVSGWREMKLKTPAKLFTLELYAERGQNVDVNWEIAFQVAFDQGPPAHGQGAHAFLKNAKDVVSAIVADFEPFLP